MKGGAFDSSGGRRFCFCFWITWLLAFKLVHSKVFQTAAKGRSSGIAWESTRQSAESGEMNRIGSTCSKDDILVYQGQTAPLPDGIPAYTVQILNACVSGCSISNIHVKCGWFSSARLVNPRVFRRIHYDDCLINDGKALGPGQTLSFQYANTFPYPLSVSSVICS